MGSQNPFLYSHFHIHPPSFTRTHKTIQYLRIQVDLVHISFVFVFVRGFFLVAGAPCATSSPVCNQVTLSLSLTRFQFSPTLFFCFKKHLCLALYPAQPFRFTSSSSCSQFAFPPPFFSLPCASIMFATHTRMKMALI